jgi:D-alanyl-D-alanine carboxypeptidase
MKLKKILFIYILFNLIFTNIVFGNNISATTNNVSDDTNTISIDTYAPVSILIEEDTGDILYEKNAYETMFPASTVKILTAIVTLENSELSDVVTVSQSSISSVPNGYTLSRIQAGETLTIENILYAMLIPSGNDAANVLAESIGGDNLSFATMMNEKAKEIGCKNSNFTNPNGVHDENMYTTAYDLALIAKYAMQNDTFRKIVSTQTYTLPSSNIYPSSDRVLTNSNHLINTTSSDFYEYATGIKTGFTNSAQNCLIASAKKDNTELISVILGSTASNFSSNSKFSDAKTLFEYGFNNYLDYYTNLKEQQKLQQLQQLETSFTSDNVETESKSYGWGYVLYLISKTTLILFAFLYIISRIIKKINKHRYHCKHAKYRPKFF